jgi:hypothetical protein
MERHGQHVVAKRAVDCEAVAALSFVPEPEVGEVL